MSDRQPRGTPTASLLSDREIAALAAANPPLIEPFVPHQAGKPSYGLRKTHRGIRASFLLAIGSERYQPRLCD